MKFILRTLIAIGGALLFAAPPLVDAQVRANPPANAPPKRNPLAKPSSPQAREHLAHGNKVYAIRDFDEAVAAYKAGALIEPAPVFDYNLGQSFRLMGRYEDAIWYYERFLDRGKPEGELLASVTDFVAQMKAELDRKAMKQKPVEPAPPSSLQPPSNVQPHVEQTIARAPAWYDDGLGWGLAGVGVAGVAVGGWLLVDAAKLNGDIDTTSNQQDRDRLKEKLYTRNVLGTVIGVGGVGLLVAGIVKLAIYPKEHSQAAKWSITVSHSSVMVRGNF